MIKLNSKYPSKVKYVKHRTNDNGALTTFSVGDKVKDSDPPRYVNYTVTVYNDLQLNDGDEVTFTAIESLSTRVYNGKDYNDIVARVTVHNAVQPASAFTPAYEDTAESLPFEL